MQNDYTNKPGQTASDKASEFTRSAGQKVEEKGKEMAGDAQKMLREGKEQAGEFMCALNKQVRENPWPVIAGVAVGSFLLASLMNKASK